MACGTKTRLREDADKTFACSITIKGVGSKEKALSAMVNLLKPEVRAAITKIAESPKAFTQDGDSFRLEEYVCCYFDTQEYGICDGEGGECPIVDEGCPA